MNKPNSATDCAHLVDQKGAGSYKGFAYVRPPSRGLPVLEMDGTSVTSYEHH